MIYMPEHPISEMYKRITMKSWKKFNYEVELFTAVTPKDLYKKTKLDFALKGVKGREFTQTEKAVWYSHFELWCECVKHNKPVLIIEHDSKLLKQLPDFNGCHAKVLSFINRDYKPKGKWPAPGSGYYITPQVARVLIANAVCKPIGQNSDGHLSAVLSNFTVIDRHKSKDHLHIEQINIDGLNTIDHKNPNRNYVGLDYEKIDIPSLHGQEI